MRSRYFGLYDVSPVWYECCCQWIFPRVENLEIYSKINVFVIQSSMHRIWQQADVMVSTVMLLFLFLFLIYCDCFKLKFVCRLISKWTHVWNTLLTDRVDICFARVFCFDMIAQNILLGITYGCFPWIRTYLYWTGVGLVPWYIHYVMNQLSERFDVRHYYWSVKFEWKMNYSYYFFFFWWSWK